MDTRQLTQVIADNLLLTFTRSGGPGGQNVNKVNTKVTARLPLAALTYLGETALSRLRLLLHNRINSEQEIVIQVQENRTQTRNRAAALARMIKLVCQALKKPRRRHATRPSAGSVEKRLQHKKEQAEKKRWRKTPD